MKNVENWMLDVHGSSDPMKDGRRRGHHGSAWCLNGIQNYLSRQRCLTCRMSTMKLEKLWVRMPLQWPCWFCKLWQDQRALVGTLTTNCMDIYIYIYGNALHDRRIWSHRPAILLKRADCGDCFKGLWPKSIDTSRSKGYRLDEPCCKQVYGFCSTDG